MLLSPACCCGANISQRATQALHCAHSTRFAVGKQMRSVRAKQSRMKRRRPARHGRALFTARVGHARNIWPGAAFSVRLQSGRDAPPLGLPGSAVDIKRPQPRTSRGCRDFSMIEFATHPQRPLRYRNPRRAKKMTQYTLSNPLQLRLQGLFSIRACGLGRQNLEQGKKTFPMGGIGEKNCQTQYGRQARPKGI